MTVVSTGASPEPEDDVQRMRLFAEECKGKDLSDPGQLAQIEMLAALALVNAEPALRTREALARRMADDFSADAPVPSVRDALDGLASHDPSDEHASIELRGHSRTLLHAVMAQRYPYV